MANSRHRQARTQTTYRPPSAAQLPLCENSEPENTTRLRFTNFPSKRGLDRLVLYDYLSLRLERRGL